MISHLHGTLLQKTGDAFVIDVNGIGYEVHVPVSLLTKPKIGDTVDVVIYHDIREGINALYGFESWDDRVLFKELLSVSGVGPKTALAMFGMNTAEQIVAAINDQDIAFLTEVPGIGKRTAERITIELREKISSGAGISTHSETVQALEALGYKLREIRDVVQTLPANLPLEEQIKTALQKLSR